MRVRIEVCLCDKCGEVLPDSEDRVYIAYYDREVHLHVRCAALVLHSMGSSHIFKQLIPCEELKKKAVL